MAKTAQELDQRKAGLQDDHDPSDIGQRQNNENDNRHDDKDKLPGVSSESDALKKPRETQSRFRPGDERL